MLTWHNEYRAGTWRHSWPPGPLPHGAALYATPGRMILVGAKEPPRPVELTGPPLCGETDAGHEAEWGGGAAVIAGHLSPSYGFASRLGRTYFRLRADLWPADSRS